MGADRRCRRIVVLLDVNQRASVRCVAVAMVVLRFGGCLVPAILRGAIPRRRAVFVPDSRNSNALDEMGKEDAKDGYCAGPRAVVLKHARQALAGELRLRGCKHVDECGRQNHAGPEEFQALKG